MPCLCNQWYRGSLSAFDEVVDAAQLAAQLKVAACQHQFNEALLVLCFPTPFTRRRCALIRHGHPVWVGYIDDPQIKTLRPCMLESALSGEAVAWVNQNVLAVLNTTGDVAGQEDVCGVTFSVTGGNGVAYSIVLVRSGKPVCTRELGSLVVKIRCLAEMVMRTAVRLGLGAAGRFELTRRELEVLRWTADGKCVQGVAEILGISPNTVNYHVKKIMVKMGCTSKLQAVAYAARWQLL